MQAGAGRVADKSLELAARLAYELRRRPAGFADFLVIVHVAIAVRNSIDAE